MLGRKIIAAGTFVGVVALARISVSLRQAFAANPQEVSSVLARFGYSSPPGEAELMIVGYKYALLRRPFPELDGTAAQRKRSSLGFWFVLLFAGVLVGLAGIVVEVVETHAARI
jgi:hypothetical protein